MKAVGDKPCSISFSFPSLGSCQTHFYLLWAAAKVRPTFTSITKMSALMRKKHFQKWRSLSFKLEKSAAQLVFYRGFTSKLFVKGILSLRVFLLCHLSSLFCKQNIMSCIMLKELILWNINFD